MLQRVFATRLGRSSVLTVVSVAMVALLSPTVAPHSPCKPGQWDACKPQGCCIVNVDS